MRTICGVSDTSDRPGCRNTPARGLCLGMPCRMAAATIRGPKGCSTGRHGNRSAQYRATARIIRRQESAPGAPSRRGSATRSAAGCVWLRGSVHQATTDASRTLSAGTYISESPEIIECDESPERDCIIFYLLHAKMRFQPPFKVSAAAYVLLSLAPAKQRSKFFVEVQ